MRINSAACVLDSLREEETAARDAILDNQPAPPDDLDQPVDSDSPIFDTYLEQGGSEVIVTLTNFTVSEFYQLHMSIVAMSEHQSFLYFSVPTCLTPTGTTRDQSISCNRMKVSSATRMASTPSFSKRCLHLSAPVIARSFRFAGIFCAIEDLRSAKPIRSSMRSTNFFILFGKLGPRITQVATTDVLSEWKCLSKMRYNSSLDTGLPSVQRTLTLDWIN
ncbi:hypothetical protein JG688_00005570 [Phytophthora aleatoria]|uniref:Uncharacterized protein n=1 Tax=Phytophthora aleatoria TaxID=2496075 RepID=A0A8J5J8A1_9STRA|nr:hypothetical protein JG688_00005570 [Phytophthora aleatoria]